MGNRKPQKTLNRESRFRSHLLLPLGVAAPGTGVEVDVDEELARLPHDVGGRPRLGLEEPLHLARLVCGCCCGSSCRGGGYARRGGQGGGLGRPPPRRPEREAAPEERHAGAARGLDGAPPLPSSPSRRGGARSNSTGPGASSCTPAPVPARARDARAAVGMGTGDHESEIPYPPVRTNETRRDASPSPACVPLPRLCRVGFIILKKNYVA
jgi:hypothetical protein